ncbi:MAG: glutaredoxin family protein [Promethearchaeota archaeon]
MESIDFTKVEGDHGEKDLVVYALSTCGFCRRGLQFLRDHSFAFRYVYVDQLDFDTKQFLKDRLRERFNQRVLFPFLVIDDREAVVGFVEETWKRKLGVER